MKIAIVNKSDSTGGAAVVSKRLMEALRRHNVDARMFVTEKRSNSEFVELLGTPLKRKTEFIFDRIPVAIRNGFDRGTLFKIDGAEAGFDISRNNFIREADAVILNWVNQGVVSLKGVGRLLRSGVPVIWTMHDMWNFTGICHHAGLCEGYSNREPGGGRCGFCPLLKSKARRHDYSYQVNNKKETLYAMGKISFVAVSSWLAQKAKESHLLSGEHVVVIPNAFPIPDITDVLNRRKKCDGNIKIVFGAARLDDDVKDFPMLIKVFDILAKRYPETVSRIELVLFGGIKNEKLLDSISIKTRWLGKIYDKRIIENTYLASDIVLSTSKWETLPGTLIEGQAYGCWPIAFDRGGQRDIIESGKTGMLVDRAEADEKDYKNQDSCGIEASQMADAIMKSITIIEQSKSEDITKLLHQNVELKFGEESIVDKYLNLINSRKPS